MIWDLLLGLFLPILGWTLFAVHWVVDGRGNGFFFAWISSSPIQGDFLMGCAAGMDRGSLGAVAFLLLVVAG